MNQMTCAFRVEEKEVFLAITTTEIPKVIVNEAYVLQLVLKIVGS